MKKKFTKLIAFVCIFTMLFSLVGCGKISKSGRAKELTVLTELDLKRQVESIAKAVSDMDSNLNINIEVLPMRHEEREVKLQKLRTEIMAGKGPDLYLMNTDVENAVEAREPLFENPYKTMQSGAFASLDCYMEKDTYWEEGTYREEILSAGKSDGKQFILPLSCYYPVLVGMQGAEEVSGETLGDWLAYVEESKDASLREMIKNMYLFTCARWFEPAVDYDKTEVLFDKEKWSDFASEYLKLQQKIWDENVSVDIPNYSIDYADLKMEQEGAQFLQNIPDINGRKMAAVKTYGAIGMSSDYKQEAYDFLMLFLKDEIENLKVNENEMLAETFRQIDGAYFVTDVERTIYASVKEAVDKIFGPEVITKSDWEAVADEIADQAWSAYKMQVSE